MLRSINLEFRWLRSFLAVAADLHFSRAARRLNLAQPALSAQIRQLEEAVGARLFERTNRTGGLTQAGRALIAEARAVVERADSLAGTVARAARGESGSLRLGLIPPAALSRVAEALRRFGAEFPDVELRVRQDNQAKLLASLADGELDLALARPASGDGDVAWQTAGMGGRRIFREEQGILLREDDLRTQGQRVVRLRALEGARLLLLRDNPHFGQHLLSHAARHRVRLLPCYTAEDFPSLHWMVRAGLGCAPCSLLLAETLPRGLTVCALRPAPPKLEIHALWRGAAPPPTAARWLRIISNPIVDDNAG